MANLTGWETILAQCFGVFDAEQAIYKSKLSSLNNPCQFAKAICDGLSPTDVPFNLRHLYREAIYGNNLKVHGCIMNRMQTIARNLR